MDKCKNLNKTIDDFINLDREKKATGEERVKRFGEGKFGYRTIFKGLIDKFNSEKYGETITEKVSDSQFGREFRKLYKGPDGQQAFLAALIEEMLADNKVRSFVFEEWLSKDMEQMDVWQAMKKDENGRPILKTLPYKYLNEIYHKLWNFGVEKDWGSTKFKRGRISFGRPYNLVWQDSSGGYAIMEKAVSQYSDNVFREMREFLGWDGKRLDSEGKAYGSNQIYAWTKEILDKMGEDLKQQMIDHHNGDDYARKHFVKFLTWFNNGLIRWDYANNRFEIATDHLTDGQTYTQTARFKPKTGEYSGQKGKILRTHKKKREKGEEGKRVAIAYDILLEDKKGQEPSRIINNVPVANVTTTGKDFIFEWDNFIPLVPWNKVEHGPGGQYEHKNNHKELDPRIADFLKDHFPMPPQAVTRMREMRKLFKGTESVEGRPAFKGLHQEVLEWMTRRAKETEKEVNTAIKKWFVDEQGYEYDERLVEQALQSVWDSTYEMGPDVPDRLVAQVEDVRENFTEFTVFEKLFWDTKYVEEKDAFPIQYVPNVMTQEFNRFKPRIIEEINMLEGQKAKAKTGKHTIQNLIDDLKKALDHANWALNRAAMLPEDSMLGGKIVTTRDSVHAKHITNAFDPFNMRIDDQLYETYLTNNAKTFEMNILSARHLDAIRIIRTTKKLNPQAVEDATTSLYQGTINHPDVRAMWAGVDISPAGISTKLEKLNLNISAERLEMWFRTNNMWFTAVLLNQFLTAAGNAGQAVEKMMIWGQEVNAWATDYYSANKNHPGLQKLLEKAQVGAFTDYFSQNLIGEVEALEEARYKVIPAITAMWKYKKAVEKKTRNMGEEEWASFEEEEFNKMADVYKKHMRQEISKNAVPSLDELMTQKKAMDRKTRLEIINKLANRAVTGNWKGAKPTGKFKAFKSKFNRDFRYMIQLKVDLMGLPTLAGTEANTRSVSWIIAAEMHRRFMKYETQLKDLEPRIEDIQQKLIKEVNPDAIKVLEEDLKALRKQRLEYMYFGKNATRLMDYDLVKALYSESSRASIGKFWGLFGDFGKQRLEMEGVKFNRAYRSHKKIRLTEEGEFPWHHKGQAGKPLPHTDAEGKPMKHRDFDIVAFFKTIGSLVKGMPQGIALPENLMKLLNEDYVPKHVRQTTNKSDAHIQRLGSIWMYTFIYNALLFGPFTAIMPNVIKAWPTQMLRKLTGSHKLGNANSDMATLLQGFLTYFAWSIWNDDDDDPEEWYDAIMQSIPIFGVGGTLATNLLGGIWASVKNIGEAWKWGEKIVKPWVPKLVHPIVEDIIEETNPYKKKKK